jgi:hypothetical protein
MRKEDVDREAASAICGKMEKQTAKVEILPAQTQQDSDKLFLKTFLIDASISGNAWGVSKQSILDNIQTFVGKPLVLYRDAKGELDHPPDSDAQSIAEWSAVQEPFRIGTIVDVVRKEQFQQGPHDDQYFAIIEVQDKDAKDILQGTDQTLYVSPALADLHRNLVANRSGEIVAEESDRWVGMHLALVRQPAFGIRKAQITAKCGGDEQTCIAQLRRARLARENFCVRAALLNTSQVSSPGKNRSLRLSEQEERKEESTVETTERKTTEKKSESDLERENAKLKEQISLLQSRLKDADILQDRIGKLENEIEGERIDKFLAKDNRVPDERLRRDKIRVYIGKGLKVSDVEEMWAGIPTATPQLKKARLVETSEGRAVLGQSQRDLGEDEKTQAMEALQAIDGRFL